MYNRARSYRIYLKIYPRVECRLSLSHFRRFFTEGHTVKEIDAGFVFRVGRFLFTNTRYPTTFVTAGLPAVKPFLYASCRCQPAAYGRLTRMYGLVHQPHILMPTKPDLPPIALFSVLTN